MRRLVPIKYKCTVSHGKEKEKEAIDLTSEGLVTEEDTQSIGTSNCFSYYLL
jgi:hypothetical protein